MPAAAVVTIIAVVAIVLARVYYLVWTIVARSPPGWTR